MNCSFTEMISSLIDGELSTTEARDVERHLINCSECQDVRADFLNLRSQIASFETSLQPAVQNRALKKILSRERRVPALQWAYGTQAVAFAMLLIVGAIIGLIIYQSRATQTHETAVVQTPSPVPAASVEQHKQPAPEASPAREAEQPNKETHSPRRTPSAPVKRAPVREPKPGEQFAALPERVRSADAETLTAMHFEKSETLLRAFRNVRSE